MFGYSCFDNSANILVSRKQINGDLNADEQIGMWKVAQVYAGSNSDWFLCQDAVMVHD